MTIERLRELLQEPRTHELAVGTYRGLYGLGITREDDRVALYLRQEGAPAGVRTIVLDREAVPLVVAGQASTSMAAAGPREGTLAGSWPTVSRVIHGVLGHIVGHFRGHPEAKRQRPLAYGLAIHNRDRLSRDSNARPDSRDSNVRGSGSLGCFVALRDGSVGLLSACHVMAQPGGQPGDVIQQPAGKGGAADLTVATLESYVPLKTSPPAAQPQFGDVSLNEVDSATARLRVEWKPEYLSQRSTPPPDRVGNAAIGDPVFKIAPTTGRTHGVVRATDAIVGVPYSFGTVWFRDTLIIESRDPERHFAFAADSGSLLVNETTTEAVGIVYAIDGKAAYACRIARALELLECRFITAAPTPSPSSQVLNTARFDV